MRTERALRQVRKSKVGVACLAGLLLVTQASASGRPGLRLIPAGSYTPFFKPAQKNTVASGLTSPARVHVDSFKLDRYPVTNEDFLKFVTTHPAWRRSKIKRIFAEKNYLQHWKGDLALKDPADLRRPVTNVSWFSASAYCQSMDLDLPTTDQWEYALDDAGRKPEAVQKIILEWYSLPNRRSLPAVGSRLPNGYGIHDLVGLIWEWTQDYNSTLFGSELRTSGIKDDDLFCGAGSQGTMDPSDSAKFMRYSLRSSLQADYTLPNLGFRCARNGGR